MPRVINKHHGNVPSSAVYIGRPTEWGNPFSHLDDTKAEFKVAAREDAVAAYRKWIEERIQQDPSLLGKIRHDLGGKDLVCWCAPKACHGDVLMELANPKRTVLPTGGRWFASGHRFVKDVLYRDMVACAIVALEQVKPDELVVGGALGWDMACMEAAVKLAIPFNVFIPFHGHDDYWASTWQVRFYDLIRHAKKVLTVSRGDYMAWKLMKRNTAMVDWADKGIVLFDPEQKTGGTLHAVHYAMTNKKPCYNAFSLLKKTSDTVSLITERP